MLLNTAYLLLNASKKLKYNLNQTMEHYGLTAQQWAVIQRIGQSEESLTAGQISQSLDIDKQTLSGIIKRLEEKNLIVRHRVPTDRRAFLLHLSSDEEKDLRLYKKASEEVLEQFLSPLTLTERETLDHLLSKLQYEGENG